MAVPSYITERLKLAEMHRRKIDEAWQADHVVQAARRAAHADLNKRRSLLGELAIEICSWRDALVKKTDLWKLLGGVRLEFYVGWFWDGLPMPPDNHERSCTSVSLDGPNHQFLIEEWRGGQRYREVGRPSTPLIWLDMVHPIMIEDLQTFLSGPEAWQPITDELDRRLATFTNR